MARAIILLPFVLLSALYCVVAFNVAVLPQQRRCFFEMLDKGDYFHISFQVGEGGHLDIDFWVSESNFTPRIVLADKAFHTEILTLQLGDQ